MTYFFGDGFDCYRDITDVATYWDGAFGGTATLALSASGRFAGSRGVIGLSGGVSTPHIAKTSGVNDAVHHISVAIQGGTALTGTNAGFWITFYDGATAQCTVAFRTDGALLLMSGTMVGTVLATYTGAIAALNIWYQFEIEVVINNTTGSISVRRNGSTSNDFTATGLNTRASANNYANKIGLGCYNPSSIHTIDDFLWRSDASSVAWIGDVRCYTRMPAADSAVQFTRSGSVVPVVPYVGSSSTGSSANSARYNPFYASCSGTITSATVVLASGYTGTGNLKVAIFTDNSGAPGTSLGSAIAATITQGNNTATFGSPPSVIQGTKYWLGAIVDTGGSPGWVFPVSTTGTYGNSASTASTSLPTYAAFPTNNPTITGIGAQANIFTVNITPTTAANANLVAEVVQDATAGYVLSSTNGQADLYTLAATPSTPAVVIGVTTRGLFSKSDAGTRNATVQIKSGGTTVAGTSTALPVGSWQWISRNDLVDPATSTAWTASGVNAALVGPAVTA